MSLRKIQRGSQETQKSKPENDSKQDQNYNGNNAQAVKINE